MVIERGLEVRRLLAGDAGLQLRVVVENLPVALLFRRELRILLRGALKLPEEQKGCDDVLADAAVLLKVRAGTAAGQGFAEADRHLVVVIALDGKLKNGLVLGCHRVGDTTVLIIRKAIRIDFVTLRIALDKCLIEKIPKFQSRLPLLLPA